MDKTHFQNNLKSLTFKNYTTKPGETKSARYKYNKSNLINIYIKN